MPIFTIAKALLASPVAAAWGWIRNGGWKVLLIALGLALGALAVRSCTTQGAETKAAQVALTAARSETAFVQKASAETARAETHNIAAKAIIQQEETEGLARTKAALSANPDWASQPIPADILSSLQDN